MAGTDVLEREIEKRIGEQSAQKTMSEEERRHRAGMSETMEFLKQRDIPRYDEPAAPPVDSQTQGYNLAREQIFSDRAPAYFEQNQGFDARAEYEHTMLSDRAPAYQNPYATTELHTPVVPNSPTAPSAARRIADYVPVTVGMQEIQRFGDMPAVGNRVVDYAPPKSETSEKASARRAGLFENIIYKDGELLDMAVEAPEKEYAPASKPAYAPAYSPSYMPESVPYTEDEIGDTLPTARTMDILRQKKAEVEEEKNSFLSALSKRTKLVLVAVAAIIVLLIAAICVNTAIINSLNADIAVREEQLAGLTQQMDDINGQIADLTSEDFINEWAQANGLQK